jgi:Tfp pilus assembly protein PilX
MEMKRVHSNERGIALVMAMLILLVMTLLGLVLMAGVSLNRQLAGNDQRMRQSLNIAEAGVGEALARIRNQETGMSPADYRDVCQVFNVLPGSVPVLGADSVALATAQPAGQYLNYTVADKGPNVLTIAWKKDPTGLLVMRYDPLITPHVNTATGYPIYTVTSTGRVGSAKRTVVTEVIQKPFTVNVRAALAADVPIDFVGNAAICGYNHRGDTPYDDGKDGRGVMPGDATHCIDNEQTLPGYGNLPGAWSSGPVTNAGASMTSGSPVQYSANQSGFYAGPWEAFGMTASEYWSWIGGGINTAPTNWNGVYYWDNNNVTQDQSATLGLHSVNGEGFLYVDGNLTLNAGFHYKGLVYVEGDLSIAGQAWVLGGLIVNGQTSVKPAGGMTILYSSEAITQALAKYGGQFVTLSWREN